MKKFITITAIVLLIVCLLGVMTACGSTTKTISIKRAKISINHTAPATFTSDKVTEVGDLQGLTIFDATLNGVLALFTGGQSEETGDTLYTLYNVETGTILAKNTTDRIQIYSYEQNAFYLRSTLDKVSNTYTTSLYTAKGDLVQIHDAAGDKQDVYHSGILPTVTPVTSDVYSYADNYFRVDEDGYGISVIGREASLVGFNYNFTDKNDKYYYQIETNNGRALVFDKKLNLVSAYYVHGEYNVLNIFVLESGNLFVQTVSQVMDEAKDYTYISNSRKYLMKTYIFDVKKGKTTEKKFKYRVMALAANDGLGDITFKAENVALIYAIEDERLLNGNYDMMTVSITNNLTIKGRMDRMIDAQTPGSIVQTLNNYLVIETPVGKKLVTASGKVIGDISYTQNNSNEGLFATNGKLYNYNLKVVLDYAAEGYNNAISWLNNCVILSKTVDDVTTYYRMDASMEAPVAITDDTSTYQSLPLNRYVYAIKKDADYTYYNEKGDILSALPSVLITRRAKTNESECFLYSATVDEVEHYYRFSK